MLILDGFYQSDSYRSWLKSWGVWRSTAAFDGQKLKKAQTKRADVSFPDDTKGISNYVVILFLPAFLVHTRFCTMSHAKNLHFGGVHTF
jgi:hypothetical protein